MGDFIIQEGIKNLEFVHRQFGGSIETGDHSDAWPDTPNASIDKHVYRIDGT